MAGTTVEDWVFFLNENLRVKVGEIDHELAEDGVGWVALGIDAETDRELGLGVGEPEGRGEAFVQANLYTLDRTDDGNVGDFIFGQRRRCGRGERCGVVAVTVRCAYP